MLVFNENCCPSSRQIICKGISDCDLLSRKAPLFSEERISDAGRCIQVAHPHLQRRPYSCHEQTDVKGLKYRPGPARL
jgi:hypothetical protein